MTPPAKAARSSLGSADRCSGRIWNFMVPPKLLGGNCRPLRQFRACFRSQLQVCLLGLRTGVSS